MRLDLSLRQLEAFVQVADSGSFRRAAARLGQAQPVLSRLIGQAEQTLGARLFDRDTRRVEITPAGRELLPLAQRLLRDFDDTLGDFGAFMAGRSGRVSMVVLPSVSVAWVPRAMAAFARTHPQVNFALAEAPADTLLALLEAGRADFGISVRPAPQQRLHYRHLQDDPFVLVCRRERCRCWCSRSRQDDPFVLVCRRDDPLAARAAVPWSVFGTRDCIMSAAHSSIRQVTDAVFLRQRTPPSPVLEYPSVAAAGALVAAGLGITALPVLALQLVDMRELVAVPLVRPAMARPIGIVTRIGRSLSPATQAFMASLQAAPAGAPDAP
ncbi:MAG TPA: LysR family transcriptional regulator [Ottowia sp.]|nr:LysR family transcriptional regulator [Burkholderiales bacterium]HNE59498.1 LysR family transcriptional regulator [Ottowia sp.]HNK52143.1 LysR family transcriptional regulator [Ottowia sp.]HNL42575.1 LysR family transcriptional regulator [Ottowia sp.]HNN33685.1 LysR family transcriptional regulator [Ottowia sp.]